MNTLTMTVPGGLRSHSHGRARTALLRPLHAWSTRRTALTALALFVCVFALGVEGWLASGLSQRDAARTALAATQRKADDARGIVAALPELRARVAATSMTPATWTAADALHAVAAFAAQSGLRVTEIEPQSPAKSGARTSTQPATERALTFRADGAFPEVRRFLEALAGLPRLIVPEAVQIKRQAGAVTIDATLRIHETLPAVPLSEPARTNAFIVDPFGRDGATGLARDAGMLLVGTMVTRHRAMSVAAIIVARAAMAADVGDAPVAPLPPLPASLDTLPTDQFAIDTAIPLAPPPPPQTTATASAEKPAAESAEPLEGPPVPLRQLERLSGTKTDDGKPITLDLKNADLSAALQGFARFTGLNIIASEKVRGLVSINLVAVPWRRAFDTLLEVNGLAMEQHGNVIWVAPLAELAAREKLRYEAHARAAELEPLASRTFTLRYPRAEDVRKLLTGSGTQRVLSKRGSAMADARTNLLFVTDLDARVQQIAELIASIDRPTPQVMIEARIVEGETGLSRNLGVKLGVAPTGDSTRGIAGGKDGVVYDLSARPLNGLDAATAGLTLFAAQATRLLDIELSALESEGRGQIVSRPRVVTADRVKAIVEQGTELPYQAKVGNGVSGVQFRRAALKLEVEPQITPHGHVILDLDVAKDSVGEQTAAGPAINTKHVQTRVEVEDGGTVAIGGISEDERVDVTGVPGLSKLPLIGWLFRHDARRKSQSELVILITPHVVAAKG